MAESRLSLDQLITTRDGTLSKDSYMQNMMKEEKPGRKTIVKRPGLSLVRGFSSGSGHGMFQLKGSNYAVIDSNIWNIATGESIVIPGAPSPVLAFDVISDQIFNTSIIAVLKTTAAAYTFDGVTVTQITDTNYPAATTRGLALLDGTFYVLDTSGNIYGSAIQDPTTWSALNFLGIDQSLGTATCLFRHLNYVLAFATDGMQAFYDSGNPPPGSPLSPVGNATYRIGCASAASVVSTADMTIFMSKSALTRGRSISALDGLSLVTLSTPFIEKILNRSNLSQVYAFSLSTSGHNFYILTLADIAVTLAFDMLSKDWYVWTSTTATGVQGYFPFGGYLNSTSQDLLLHLTSGAVMALDPAVFQDNGQPINCTVVTEPYDGGTVAHKFFSGLNLIGDTVPTTVAVSYSDDDYQTWNTPRTVDMGSVRKQLRGLGRSRKRAFRFTHTDNTELRLDAVEFDLNLGSS